ncbi:MAG: hypothetical protein JW750_05725 [Anaerolineaceae bacterium]|nr:hypothetical protein [Anaerolineaceae bacterium]
MKRVVVVGTTGSGKTTFSKRLAERIGAPHIELDRVHFLPGWESKPWDVIRAEVAAATEGERWVVDGNYSRIRDLLWGRADTVIWLNYPLHIAFARVFKRTMERVISGYEAFDGCKETFKSQFLSKDSLLVWFFQTFWKHKKHYPVEFAKPEFAHLMKIAFEHPREAKAFLRALDEE